MSRLNPLVVETLRGLGGKGDAQQIQVGYLLLQALALLVWWPRSEMERLLAAQSEPSALLAVVIALGVTVSLYSIRAGAEEILLPGQRPLREWVAGTRVGVGRIVAGYLCAHLLQTVHLLLMSSPLLLAGLLVSGGAGRPLAWVLLAVVLMATVYRLAGALVYLLIGHHATRTFVTLRALLLLSYAALPFALPAASHPLLGQALLTAQPWMQLDAGGVPGEQVFVAAHAIVAMLFTLALHQLLSRHRRRSGVHG